jgi:Fe-S cluster biogenesis protein NfuA
MTPSTVPSDDRIYDVVDGLFRDEINPMVARHGGKVELVDVQEATVVVRMMGGCQGCGMATVTLRQGIEAALRQAVPAVRGIKDITDHASGRNPYYAPGAAGPSAVAPATPPPA